MWGISPSWPDAWPACCAWTPQQLTAQLQNGKKAGLHQVRVRADLAWEEMARVETFQPELPGVLIQVQPKREYRQKGMACHVLGYLGEISDAQLKSGKFPDYKMGDYLGKCGVELAWEKYLRGKRGSRRIEVDAYGRELGQLDSVFPTPGANIYLTLDNRMQREAEACLEGQVGAIVALDPNTGRVLALASSPTFSQEAFERGLTNQEWQKINQDKTHPLENRALRGQYPPGSTFKIVMAVAGLEEKVITPSTIISCTGVMRVGDHEFHCWRKGGHGAMNLYRAMVHSCDIYFYEVGRRLGIERINEWSRRFGLGAPTGLDLDKEMTGLVPSPAWKKARFHQPWHEGETILVSIGQGYNLTTPIQMARVVAAIANGGIVYKPYLVEKVESPGRGDSLPGQARGAIPSGGQPGQSGGGAPVPGGGGQRWHRPRPPACPISRWPAKPAPPRWSPLIGITPKRSESGGWKITPGSWPTPRPTTPRWPWRF